ncbi:MAG: phosphoribosylformylglycinamidine synthase subunit PurQ [Armatimonadetes bacterium]|nr:phosphoribosylformylglycinamidine synthase subunit PurQ [Armatimonadota bacterium]
MRVAVVRFPGSNCDQDGLYSLRGIGIQADYVWQDDHSLKGFDAVWIPGGFSYGDYLRCGAMAARAPIMDEVKRFADEGRIVFGICNGFQVLCESGILPGALMGNLRQKFLCRYVHLDRVNTTSPFTQGVTKTLRIPIAHGEGRYVADKDTLKRLEGEGLVAFRYVAGPGETSEEEFNPNGSDNAIAGILNPKGNVLGMMPHPERSVSETLGSTDGLQILQALKLVGVA